MYFDAKRRREKAIMWFFIGLVLGVIDLIVWLVYRRKKKLPVVSVDLRKGSSKEK